MEGGTNMPSSVEKFTAQDARGLYSTVEDEKALQCVLDLIKEKAVYTKATVITNSGEDKELYEVFDNHSKYVMKYLQANGFKVRYSGFAGIAGYYVSWEEEDGGELK